MSMFFESAGETVTKYANANSCLAMLCRSLSRVKQKERGFTKGSQKVTLYRA